MIDESCLSLTGMELWVRPQYGWGWQHRGEPFDFESVAAAGSFLVSVERFFRFRGEIRGFVGVCSERAGRFARLHVLAWEMVAGKHDFDRNICPRYDLYFGTQPPEGIESPEMRAAATEYIGYAAIGIDREAIESALDS